MKSLPARAATSLERRLFSLCERFGLTTKIGKKPPSELRALSLLHYEIHTMGFVDAFSRHYPNQKEILIKEANEHSFLGREQDIPWHQDVVSGFIWDATQFYDDVRYGERPGVDVKDPWERSRCHHLIRLGQAYILTQDEKYAHSFFSQVQNWIHKNPRGRGVNWVSPMEISIRACNWLLAWDFFRESPSLPDDFQGQFTSSLHVHGTHIARRMEHGGKTSTNHYVANLLGLAYIGVALEREDWTSLAERELENEIQVQTYADGMHYESSVAYHRLVAEMFFFFSLLSTRHPDLFTLNDKRYARSLDGMLDFTSRIMDMRGHVPMIGDNDSGRFHSLFPREDSDMRYLVGFGRGSIEESDSAWLSGINPHQFEEGFVPSPHGSSGLIGLRQKNQLLVVSAQPNGAGGAGHHTHNDKLSFTLSVDGHPFFIDPGTAAYTGDPVQRNLFRSTVMHNTVAVDGQEQNRFVAGSLFQLRNDTDLSVIEHKSNSKLIAFHTGYERLRKGVRHGRRVEWRDDSWVIEDKFTGDGQHDFKWSFILGENVTVESHPGKKLSLTSDGIVLDFWSEETEGQFRVEETLFAPAYRVTRPTKKITLEERRALPFTASFLIRRLR